MPVSFPLRYRYRISGAAVAGPSHLAVNRPCEDAWEGVVFGERGAAIAVSDGLGSAPLGRKGASIAVSAAITAISRFFSSSLEGGGYDMGPESNSDIVRAACRAAHDAVFCHASASGILPNEYACTLILLLWHGDAVTAARIGDGAVVCMQNDEHILLSAPDERKYVNEVVPLTAEEYEGACVVSPDMSGICACAVFTDGCERLVLEKKPDCYYPYEPFFRPFFPAVVPIVGTAEGDGAIADLLVSDTFISFSEDDKTLVVVVSDEGRDEDPE